MNTSNIYRFNGTDPFDNWTIKNGALYGYYPRNSIINELSKRNSVLISDKTIIIPDGVLSINGSCFRNNNKYEIIVVDGQSDDGTVNIFDAAKAVPLALLL